MFADKRRSFGTLIGAAAVAVGLWQYGSFLLLPPLEAVIAHRDSAAMLRPWGGPLTGNDFRHIYAGSWALWHGLNPYDPPTLMSLGQRLAGDAGLLPFVYLPFTGLAMGPLVPLTYPQAFLAWFLANHAMIWLAVLASFAALKLQWTWRSATFAVLILSISYPLYRTLSAGQLNVPLALAYALFWLALSRQWLWLAGLIGASAMLYKLSPGILLLYLLWTRRWRAAGWMAWWGLILLAVSIAWAGLNAHLAFLPLARDMGYGRSTWAGFGQHFYCDPANQSFNSLFHHLFARTPIATTPWIDLGPGAANAATWAASLCLLGAVLWMTWPRRSGVPTQEDPLCYSLFIFVSLFLPSLCWDHYFVQLLFPLLAVFQAMERRPSILWGAVFVVSLLIVSLPFNFWDERWLGGAGLLMMSWKLWGALGLFAANAALCMRANRPAPNRPA